MGAIAALIFILSSSAAPRGGADTNSVRPLSAEKANEMWGEFSRAGISGDYCMGFTITHRPRKGEQTCYTGEIFGTKTGEGYDKTRIRVFGPRGGQTAEKCIADYILINNPAEPKVFKLSNGSFVELPPTEWSKPLAEGFLYSPFDLLMPYKFWKPAYEGAGRIGQAVHFFRLAPHDSAAAGQNSVRLALSREFSSPVQAQILSSDSRPLKTLKLASVKKIDSRWIMREAELRDESSRDKDILRFESANLRDSLPKSIFDTQSPDMSPKKPDMTKI